LKVTSGIAVLLPTMLSIPEVMPVPSNVIVELPSIVTGGFVDPMNMVDVTAMVCALSRS